MGFFAFFVEKHDIALVLLAAVICLASAYACVGLLRHARQATGRWRWIWTSVAALAVGFGIWTTHFIAMLAFRPGFILNYDFGLTAISLVIAILVCGVGIAMTAHSRSVMDRFLGGAVVGVAISSMHYTGMLALALEGQPVWNSAVVTVSIVAGIAIGGLAFVFASDKGARGVLVGSGLLTAAICVMHFTAMAAADFSLCVPLAAAGDIDTFWMSIALAGLSFLIFAAVFGSMLLDDADRRRTVREEARRQHDAERIARATNNLELALNHMAQGLIYYGVDGTLQFYNRRILAILGLDPSLDLTGFSFREMTRLSLVATGMPSEQIEAATERLVAEHSEMIGGRGGDIVYYLKSERAVQISHSPVGDGSWVTTVEDVTERHRSQNKIAHLARHDLLTGLPNRAAFDECFDLALFEADETKLKVAVIAIDLDGFKEINDTYGHSVGDTVLQLVAKRMMAGLKEGETIARLGGDEFAALKTFSSIDSLNDFLARLEAALFAQLELPQVTLHTAASLGIATYPQDGDDRSKLLNNADLAMYRAKAEFDRHLCFYETGMDEANRRRRAMAKAIWTAIENEEFYLVYQVQRSVETNEITGYEVLLRWNWAGHGPISPAEFIPVAEECGAIGTIGRWVLAQAAAEAAGWPNDYKIAVNISGVELSQSQLVDTVRDVLQRSGLPANRLELEVTETSIIADKTRALHNLTQIKALGVSVALDDFGTGYSSLDTLRSFPFDKIKLDRSFMQEVEVDDQSKAIIRAVLSLGRTLSVPVLAEGVETEAQLKVLRAEGCNEAQGYLLGRPQTIEWELPQRATA